MWVTIRHHVTHPSVARVFSFASKSYFFNIITQCLFEGNLKYGYSTPTHQCTLWQNEDGIAPLKQKAKLYKLKLCTISTLTTNITKAQKSIFTSYDP